MLYHVTPVNRIRTIRKQGIKVGHKPHWVNRNGVALGRREMVYVFKDRIQAVLWAAKFKWDCTNNQKMPAILEIDQEGLVLERDDNPTVEHSWMCRYIPPQQIVYDWVPTQEDVKAAISIRNRSHAQQA